MLRELGDQSLEVRPRFGGLLLLQQAPAQFVERLGDEGAFRVLLQQPVQRLGRGAIMLRLALQRANPQQTGGSNFRARLQSERGLVRLQRVSRVAALLAHLARHELSAHRQFGARLRVDQVVQDPHGGV